MAVNVGDLGVSGLDQSNLGGKETTNLLLDQMGLTDGIIIIIAEEIEQDAFRGSVLPI